MDLGALQIHASVKPSLIGIFCEFFITFLLAVISNLCHISQVSVLFPAPSFFQDGCVSYFTEEKGPYVHFISSQPQKQSLLLSPFQSLFLSLPQSLISCLRRKKKNVTYFCSLFRNSPFSSESKFLFSLSHPTNFLQITFFERSLFTCPCRLENSRKQLSVVHTIGQKSEFYP